MSRRALICLALLGGSAAAAQTPPTTATPAPAAATAAPHGEATPQITVDGRQGPRYPLFVSPMGEPFRGGEAPEKDWFAGVDRNQDGQLSRTEFLADAMRFFHTLDLDHNGEIGPGEIDRYEQDLLPEIGAGGGGGFGDGPPPPGAGRPGGGRRGGGMGGGHRGGMGGGGMGGGGMGGMGDGPPPGGGGPKPGYTYHAAGAGRFGYIATPEPVTAADTDLNRSVSDKEFVDAAGRRFALLDTNGDGAITAKELPKLMRPRFRDRGGKGEHKGDRGPPPPDGN
ncbi:EF-hand domain-containing protein [Sphingomonas sp. AP4-R1]|uniref:EF-hand domain-containing protein n=1 Tax=Sphingomonas sp. AP4-R1 TaxID=2735134 RepID=UPI0014933CD4|nr:EF-hand domain-containing protein [Sphingomonas sp. AP4-R1]QJU59514.1 EF-hand domain-containing protein [Sphingomonas sp. AP4-R1]